MDQLPMPLGYRISSYRRRPVSIDNRFLHCPDKSHPCDNFAISDNVTMDCGVRHNDDIYDTDVLNLTALGRLPRVIEKLQFRIDNYLLLLNYFLV